MALVNGRPWPRELHEVAICTRMGIGYRELQDTPADVVEDYLLVMSAEVEAADIVDRWKGR